MQVIFYVCSHTVFYQWAIMTAQSFQNPPMILRIVCVTSMMQLIAKEQLAKGAEYLGLYVDQENPVSNHVYKKVGYQILIDSIEYDRIP